MNELPLVTIMIPTYNQDKYILRAVKSAIAQDYENLEIIVSDDCSTDMTQAVLSNFSNDRILIKKNKSNLGRVGNYRNTLYNYAHGDWVINLDGDDFFIDNSFISNAIKIICKNPDVVLVFADRVKICEESKSWPKVSNSSNFLDYTVIDGTKYILNWPESYPRISHETCLYKRSIALARNFYSVDIISSDYESLFKLILGNKIAFIPNTVAVWWEHGKNASENKSVIQRLEDFSLFESVSKFAIENIWNIRYESFSEKAWKKKIDTWKKRNIERKIYVALLAYVINNENDQFKSFFKLCMSDVRYRKQFLIVLFSPVSWLKILIHKINRKRKSG